MPRLQPLSLLAALPALLGGGLAWAQLEASQPEESAAAASTAPVAPLLPPPGSTAVPLRPDPARLSGAATPPKRFDQSLDELVRQGVVTPNERNLVSGGGGALAPLDVGAFQQACRG